MGLLLLLFRVGATWSLFGLKGGFKAGVLGRFRGAWVCVRDGKGQLGWVLRLVFPPAQGLVVDGGEGEGGCGETLALYRHPCSARVQASTIRVGEAVKSSQA